MKQLMLMMIAIMVIACSQGGGSGNGGRTSATPTTPTQTSTVNPTFTASSTPTTVGFDVTINKADRSALSAASINVARQLGDYILKDVVTTAGVSNFNGVAKSNPAEQNIYLRMSQAGTPLANGLLVRVRYELKPHGNTNTKPASLQYSELRAWSGNTETTPTINPQL